VKKKIKYDISLKLLRHFENIMGKISKDVIVFVSPSPVLVGNTMMLGITFYNNKTDKASMEFYTPITSIATLKENK
jgi:hypothetical protein